MDGTPRTPITLTDISTNADADMPVGGSCGCCTPPPPVQAQPTTKGTLSAEYSVSGLTCGSCAGRVSSAINALNGVQDVHIALVPDGTSTISVTSSQPLAHRSVQDAVEKAGYQLTTA